MNIQQKYAIFDMDGTLVSSMEYWDKTCMEFLRELGLDDPALFEVMKPMTLPQSAVFLQNEYGCTFSAREMSARMCALMRTHYTKDVRIKPGVLPFLEALKAKGVHMCIASSTPDDLIRVCLEATGLQPYFAFAVSAESVGKGKTEPDIYWKAAKMLGSLPAETIVFEDAKTAGDTARKAGFAVAAVYDATGKEEWDAFSRSADVVIADWRDALL